MKRLLLAWFFAVWGVGGGNFYVVGPFDTKVDCDEIHDTMKKDTIGLNSFSKCWERAENSITFAPNVDTLEGFKLNGK